VENYCRAGQATDDIWRMCIACWITNAINTPTVCSTYCFSCATMVARTRFIVALYVHCLSCFIYYVHYHKLRFSATSHGEVLPVHSPCENNTTNSRYIRTYTTARYTVFIIYCSYMFRPQNMAIFREITCFLDLYNVYCHCLFVCLFCRDSPPMGQVLLIHEVSRPDTTTHHSR